MTVYLQVGRKWSALAATGSETSRLERLIESCFVASFLLEATFEVFS